MTKPKLPIRYRQAGALGLLAIVLGVIAMFIVVPLVEYHDQLQTEIHDQRILLARLNAFAKNKSAAEEQSVRNQLRLQSGIFLPGGTDAMRAANLQALLTEVAKQKGIRLRSTRSEQSTSGDGLQFISAQADITANIKQMQELLLVLESSKPLVFVRSLHVSQNIARRGSHVDLLNIRVGVEGAAIAKEKEATP